MSVGLNVWHPLISSSEGKTLAPEEEEAEIFLFFFRITVQSRASDTITGNVSTKLKAENLNEERGSSGIDK